VEPTEPHNKWD